MRDSNTRLSIGDSWIAEDEPGEKNEWPEGAAEEAWQMARDAGEDPGKWIEDRDLPHTVSQHGSSVEEIFVMYEELKAKYGDRIPEMPLGAIGIYTFVHKLRVGLQQFMAGARRFSLPAMDRRDLMCLTEEAARVSGIPYVMDAYQGEAEQILAA